MSFPLSLHYDLNNQNDTEAIEYVTTHHTLHQKGKRNGEVKDNWIHEKKDLPIL